LSLKAVVIANQWSIWEVST